MLDEPTLGLDLLFRRSFYDNLLNDYFDKERTILVTTHQVEEIENILTDVMFIEHGKIVLDSPMESLGERFAQLVPAAGQRRRARARSSRSRSARCSAASRCCSTAATQHELAALGEIRAPSVADLFVAMMQPERTAPAPSRRRPHEQHALMLVRREFWENRSLWIAPLVIAGVILVIGRVRRHAMSTTALHVGWIDSGIEISERTAEHRARDGTAPIDKRRRSTPIALSMLTVGAAVRARSSWCSSICSTACSPSARTAASCSGSRCRCPTPRWCCPSSLTALVVVPLFVLAGERGDADPVRRSSGRALHGIVLGDVLMAWDVAAWAQLQASFLVLVPAAILWYLPIAGYLMLVSVWARRNAFLWAVLPPVAILR